MMKSNFPKASKGKANKKVKKPVKSKKKVMPC